MRERLKCRKDVADAPPVFVVDAGALEPGRSPGMAVTAVTGGVVDW